MTVTTMNDCSPTLSTRSAVPRRDAPGWAARLVADDSSATFSDLVRRTAVGLGLSSFYGLAIGTRQGGRALLSHTVGVPLGLLLIVVAGAPSMFVFLSLCRAPIDAKALASTAARGVGSAGLLLGGLAPAAALFVVSSETPKAASSAVLAGLLLGGGVALARATWEVFRSASRGRAASVLGGMGVAIGFAVFAVALAVRIWSAVLPILGGGS